jgi:PPOX class probable F420-dependent enzyme
LKTHDWKPVIPENYSDLLSSTALAHVATIGPKGEPQSNPVWFDWDGEHVKFSQTKTRQKYRNLNRDPRVALSIVDPENPYRYLEVRGEVTRIEEDLDLDFINSMSKKYLGLDKYPNHQPGDERVVIFVEPRHTTQMGR